MIIQENPVVVSLANPMYLGALLDVVRYVLEFLLSYPSIVDLRRVLRSVEGQNLRK